MSTPTELALIATFGPAVPLEAIADHYLGVEPRLARKMAAKGELPVPTFRLRDSNKAPLMVRSDHLAAYIDHRSKEAQKEWTESQLKTPAWMRPLLTTAAS